MNLGPQLHVTPAAEVLPEAFTPARNPGLPWCKPAHGTGIWTSTYDHEDGQSGWTRWCEEEHFGVPDWHGVLLHPLTSARIYTIDCYADLEIFVRRYPVPSAFTGIDFEAARGDWDAIHLTEAGEALTRHSYPLSLYGWDCESTIWLCWVFEPQSERVGRRPQAMEMLR